MGINYTIHFDICIPSDIAKATKIKDVNNIVDQIKPPNNKIWADTVFESDYYGSPYKLKLQKKGNETLLCIDNSKFGGFNHGMVNPHYWAMGLKTLAKLGNNPQKIVFIPESGNDKYEYTAYPDGKLTEHLFENDRWGLEKPFKYQAKFNDIGEGMSQELILHIRAQDSGRSDPRLKAMSPRALKELEQFVKKWNK